MIDLSSDTATRPTQPMRAAIAAAVVGDEQRGEDPTVNALEARVAKLFGKEDAVFLPSGTMCNHIAIKVHTQPADAIIAHRDAHIIRAEGGGPAFHSGVLMHALDGASGRFTVEQVIELFTAGSHYEAATRVLCLEQTHNFGGGSIWPRQELEAVCAAAHERGMLTHLDGARIMNAGVASGIAAEVSEGLGSLPGITMQNAIETNIVFFSLDPERAGMTSMEFLDRLAGYDVRMGTVRSRIRAVTHLDVSPEDIERTIEAAQRVLAGSPSPVTSSPRDVARVY